MGTIKDLQIEIGKKVERLDADLIVGHLLGKTREELIISDKEEVSEHIRTSVLELAERRARGEPLAYLLGKKSFFGIDFIVRPGVLVPRPESEHLVEEALQWLATQNQETYVICDLGCGSGCIGLSILQNSTNSNLLAVDKSEIACAVTSENARMLGLSERVKIVNLPAEDLNEAKVDLIVANPPYVAPDDKDLDAHVRKYEPAEALFSGPSGFEGITSWKNVAAGLLRPGGLIVMEFGFKQGPRTLSIFESDPAFDSARIGKDLSGNDRYIVASRA